MPSEQQLRREEDVSLALRLQKLELGQDSLQALVASMKTDLKLNTQSTHDLLQAWHSSRSTVGFIRGCAIFAASLLAVWAGISKLWGH